MGLSGIAPHAGHSCCPASLLQVWPTLGGSTGTNPPNQPLLRPRPQDFHAAAAEAAARLVPLEVFDESEARAAVLQEQIEGLEAERDALQERVGAWETRARAGSSRHRRVQEGPHLYRVTAPLLSNLWRPPRPGRHAKTCPNELGSF